MNTLTNTTKIVEFKDGRKDHSEWALTHVVAESILPDGTPVKVSMRITRDQYVQRAQKSARVYVDVPNETILENLMNRRNRPFTEYKKHIMPAVLEMLPAMISHIADNDGVNVSRVSKLDGLKARWSQRAGCSMCPCSPGFIVDGIKAEWYQEVDIWVSVGENANN